MSEKPGQDPDKADVEAVLAGQMEQGVAILIVTHDPAQATRLAHRRYRMDAGRLEADG